MNIFHCIFLYTLYSFQFARAERVARSKSRSPEDKLSDDESCVRFSRSTAPLCSQCSEKIVDPPFSAPPSWDRGYSRSFWESHHQPVMWRHRGYVESSSYGRYPYCHMPRSWSTDNGPSPAPEVELYPDEDEDSGNSIYFVRQRDM